MCYTRRKTEGGVGALRESVDTNFSKPKGQSRNLNIYGCSLLNVIYYCLQVNESASDYVQVSELDYDKIKYVMTDGDYEQRSLLLQSLRWVSNDHPTMQLTNIH